MTGAAMRRLRGSHGDSGPLEMVILLPAVLLLFGLVVAFGRTTTAATNVEHAAAVGARAAVAAQTAGGADVRANVVVRESLAGSGLACQSQDTSVNGTFTPGGRVTVSVSCVVALGDVTRFGFLPGSRTLTASATEVIDRTRGGS
jgi:Flp pilus assembly protein TadG